jgi:hypothetical protein
MDIKAVIFGGEKGFDKELGGFLEANGGATLFAKFSQQLTVCAVYPQRRLQLNVF